jgi:hypothetical protein
MSTYSGSTFDGLDGKDIVINATAQTNKYIATDTYDQYNTTGANMDFRTGGLSSTYTFKDSSGAANTALVARDGLFTGSLTGQYGTFTAITSQTVPAMNITGPVLNSDNSLPLLKVEKTQGGVTSEFINVSPSYPVLKLNNNSSGATYLQYSQASNLPSGSSISNLIGKNTSSNANSFLLQYYYDTLEANRKFTIRAWGDTNAALEVYKYNVTGTSATTGSVVVNGDLGSTGLRSKSLTLYGTSGSARIIPATTTTSYQLTLPSNIGAVNDYLQLGSVSGTNGTLQWVAGTGGGGTGAAYIAAAAYSNSSFTFNTASIFYNLTFPTLDYNVNTGITYGTGGQSNLFQNVSGGSLYIQVIGYQNFNANATGTRTIQVITYNGSSYSYYNATRAAAASSGGTEIVVTAIVLVANNQWFGLRAMEDAANALGSSCKIQFSVLGGSGTQSVTLSALSTNQASTLFTTTAQQTGQNPTVSFDLAQTPTGSGKFVLATSPSVSSLTNTGTLTTTSIISDGGVTTSKLIETPLIIETGNTALYPSGIANLSTSNTSVLLTGSTSGFQVFFPNATTLTTGQVIKVANSTSQYVFIRTYTGVIIEVLPPYNTTYYQLTGTSILTPTSGNWDSDGLIDKSAMYTDIGYLVLKDGVNLKFYNSSGQLSIKAPSTTTTYDFILPVNQGLPGQVLTSAGGSSPMTWADAFTNQSIINSPYGGHTLGDSATVVTSSVPTVKIRGISTQDNYEVLQVINASTSSCTTTANYAPNLLTSGFVATRLGAEESNYNSISQRFYLTTRGSATDNHYSIHFYGQQRSTSVYPRNIAASDINTGTFQVYGGLTADSAYFAGTTNVSDLNVRGNVVGTLNTNIIQATTVNTTNLVVGSTPLSFSSGETTLSLWWAYATTDITWTTLYYPPDISTGTPNLKYYWQILGKTYTFSLNFRVDLYNSSRQVHVVFVRPEGGHIPPQPANSYCEILEDTSSPGYASALPNNFGCLIPAT